MQQGEETRCSMSRPRRVHPADGGQIPLEYQRGVQRAGAAAAARQDVQNLAGTADGASEPLQEMSVRDLRKVLKGALDIKESGNEAFSKGEFYRALDFYDHALKRLQTLGEREDDQQVGLRASIHYNRARAFYKIEDYFRSAEEAHACLRADPDHAKATRILKELAPNIASAAEVEHPAVAALTKDRLQGEQAKPSANRLVKGLLQLKDEGNCALLKGNATQAIATYTKAILRFAEVEHELEGAGGCALKATLFANRSQAYINLEDWEDALEDARSSLEVQPDNPKALHRKELAEKGLASLKQQWGYGDALKHALLCKNQGNVRLAEGDGKAAAEMYTDGLDWLADLPRQDESAREIRIALLSNRAQAHLKRKLWQEALVDADAVLSDDDKHVKAKFRRARALLELVRCDEAVVALQEIAAAEPGNEDVHRLLGRALEMQAEPPLDALVIQQEAQRKKLPLREGDCVEVLEEFLTDVGSSRVPGLARGKRGILISLESDFATIDFGECLRKVSRKDFEKLSKVKKEKQHTLDAEIKRLQCESEAAYDVEHYHDALHKVLAAVALLEEAVEQNTTRREPLSQVEQAWRLGFEDTSVDVAKEAKQLLMAYTQKVRCELALRDFKSAQETAHRAVKLHKWEEQRLEQDFQLLHGLRGATPLMELVSSVSDAVHSLHSADAALGESRPSEAWDYATKASRLLEKKEWQATMPLRAELFALRAEATLGKPGASAAEAEADAERSLALDVGCARAKAALRAAALRTP